VDAVAGRIGPRTKALVLNSPGNPSSTTLGRDDLTAALALAERHGLWVLSDECYEELVLDGAHVTTAALGPERVISVFSFSKTYAMTGWRVGNAVASGPVARLLAKAQEPVVSSASTISQKAAEAALTGPQDCITEMREAYRRRRDMALALLDGAGVSYVRPDAAFYLMVDVGDDAPAFCRRLLLDQRVAVVPGDAFGAGGAGLVRVSLGASDEAVAEGVSRLAAALSE
jgi:aspartate aminotransferase/aminotransferase